VFVGFCCSRRTGNGVVVSLVECCFCHMPRVGRVGLSYGMTMKFGRAVYRNQGGRAVYRN
jgi:hypothetical protein